MKVIRLFNEKKLARSREITPIYDINQILKHTFSIFTIDGRGNMYGSETLIETGIHTGFSHTLAEYLNIPDDRYFIVDTRLLYKHIKDDKPRIRAIADNKGDLVFITEDDRLLVFGKISSRVLNVDKFDNIKDENLSSKRIEGSLSDDDIEDLSKKKLLSIKINGEYLVMLSHKLISNIGKIDSQSVTIYDSGDFFIGKFTTSMNGIIVNHYYRFLKI